MKSGKLLFTLFFTTVILYNSLRVPLTYAYYYLDNAGFTELFCVNINKPELKCNGKCHLKKVTKEMPSNDESPYSLIKYKEIPLFVISKCSYKLKGVKKNKQLQIEYINLYSYLESHSIYHPPKV